MGTTDAGTGLSPLARGLTALAGVLYALLGTVAFVAPAWSAEHFPWKVSTFVAMTIGGWSLGAAFFCAMAVRDWRWSAIHPLLFFLWAFGTTELAVVIYHRSGLVVDRDHIMAIPYLLAMGVTAASAVVGIVDWLRIRPRIEPIGPPPPGWVRFMHWGFLALLVILVASTLTTPESALNGRVFPEPVTPFTVRAIGVFFLSLAVAGLPLPRARSMGPILKFDVAGQGLIVPITVAALVHYDLFDLGEHPFNALYLGAYVAAGIVAAWIVLAGRRQPGASTDPVPSP